MLKIVLIFKITDILASQFSRPAGRKLRGAATVKACAGMAIAVCLAAAAPTPVLAGAFPAEIDLSTLNGENGFIINETSEFYLSGNSVSAAGDVNGDGFGDIIVGGGSEIPVGMAFVIFGTDRGFPAQTNLSMLDGTNGFAIAGVASGDAAGYSVSNAGDVNGDGFDDIIVKAPGADVNGVIDAGKYYVVFGTDRGFPAVFELSTLNGTNGFALNGINTFDASSPGANVSDAGDINGDGFGDIIIGAPLASPSYPQAGQSYLVFGAAGGFPAEIDLATLDGTNGFIVNGYEADALSGREVSAAGDIDADGFDDFIIGAPYAGKDIDYGPGMAYVIYGTDKGFPAVIELSAIDGVNGFAFVGSEPLDGAGDRVSDAGDVNGDGIGDIIIGAPFGADPNIISERSYVVFGSDKGFPARFELSSLDGSNGFVLQGSGHHAYRASVSGAGDVNGDGLNDVIISAPGTDIDGAVNVGQSYVVFGSDRGFPALLQLSALDGRNGFALNGNIADGWAGTSVSDAGDVNGDGVDDIIIGAPWGGMPPPDRPSQAYVIYGRRVPALTVTGVCPGTVTVNISRATPGGTVWLLHSAAQGTAVVPSGRCAGTVLDLAGPTLASQRTADVTGSILELMPTTAAACGRFLQVVDAMTCTPSNVAQLP